MASIIDGAKANEECVGPASEEADDAARLNNWFDTRCGVEESSLTNRHSQCQS